MGRLREAGWNQSRAEVDFYDIKGILDLIFDHFKLPEFRLESTSQPFLHPGQGADIFIAGQPVGYCGQIHPNVQQNYELSKPAFFLELDLTDLEKLSNPVAINFQSLPKFPAVQRDLALVVPCATLALTISTRIKAIAGDLVEQVDLFRCLSGGSSRARLAQSGL